MIIVKREGVQNMTAYKPKTTGIDSLSFAYYQKIKNTWFYCFFINVVEDPTVNITIERAPLDTGSAEILNYNLNKYLLDQHDFFEALGIIANDITFSIQTPGSMAVVSYMISIQLLPV